MNKLINKKKRVLISFLFIMILAVSARGQEVIENEWPKIIETDNHAITLYQPDSDRYIDNQLKSNLAFSVKKQGGEPSFGMLWTTSYLDVDRTTRMASLATVKIDEIRFPTEVSNKQKSDFEQLIQNELPKWNIEFSIDDLVDRLDEVSVSTADFKNEPPQIIFKNEPTALITVDGEPKLKDVEKGYQLVENTGAFILKSNKDNTYYLRGGDFWYTSQNITGPWVNVEKVPSKVKKIAKKAENENVDDEEKEEDIENAPNILVVTTSSELIVFKGEPEYSPLQKTNLLFVENTESDVFMDIKTQTYYILISGRWFTTQDLKGSWKFIPSEDLPEDFKSIGSDSKKSNVLSSVAGTKEAKNAVYDAQLPQTAAVARDTKATEIKYNGKPEFKKIEGLKLQYAVNTESDVFKDGKTYFLCDNAIWFTSTSPNGPWAVADDRPLEIEKIPASNPNYNTKYVYIYETSPTVVYVGYTPGYYGSYVYGPNVVYGTGFYYNPWYGGHYYHHHYTYGFSVRYHPYYGWSFGFSYGSPYYWYGHSYWGIGYHHWGPPYYRPPYYYGRNYRPRPAHPIYNGRRGVSTYRRPTTRPAQKPGRRPTTRPTTRPSKRPATRPATRPNTKPSSRPATKPSTRPNTKPSSRPATKPSTRPSTKPSSRPVTRPSTRPSTRPISRPTPSTRPAQRPTSRPTARPATRATSNSGGGRSFKRG